MINEPTWHEQSGGLHLAIETFNKENPAHRKNAREVMRSIIGSIASTHQASFNKSLFNNNIAALYRGDLQLSFFLAKWDICSPNHVCLGGAIHWKTYGINDHGIILPAEYTEDLCLLPSKIRPLTRLKPQKASYPEKGLAQLFEKIREEEAKDVLYRFAEVDPDNTRMMRPLLENGGYFGKTGESAVLELGRFPSGLMDFFPMNIEIVMPKDDDNNCFVTRWQEDDSEIAFIVTKGQATAIGQPRADIRPWRKGKLPPEALFRDVMASSLRTIEGEINWREWGKQQPSAPSPIIPITQDKKAITKALQRNCRHDLFCPQTSYAGSEFAPPVSDAHIFIIDDKPMIKAFEHFGAKPRIFGNKPMLPGVNTIDPHRAATLC